MESIPRPVKSDAVTNDSPLFLEKLCHPGAKLGRLATPFEARFRTRTTGREATDRETNLPPRLLTAKARGSKKHFAPSASRQLFTY